jgi:hypothetical protein
VNIAIANERLAVACCPSFSAEVEIERRRKHRIDFNGVEEIRVPVEIAKKTGGCGKEWMRRYDQALFALSKPAQILERVDGLGPVREIDEEDMSSFDRFFYPGK